MGEIWEAAVGASQVEPAAEEAADLVLVGDHLAVRLDFNGHEVTHAPVLLESDNVVACDDGKD